MTADPHGGRRRRHGPVLGSAPLAATLAAVVTAAAVLGVPRLRGGHPAASAAAVRVSTAQVVRTNRASTTGVGGALGYQGSYTLANQAQGTAYTQLPAAGARVRRGQRLYEVDGTPVILFYGARPEWRALGPGVTAGPDVAQLDANLIALGYASAADLAVSDYFTPATGYAVARWQAAAGLPVTGTVPLGQVSYAPGPLRITGVSPGLGAMPQPGGQLLTATSPVPVVAAALPVSQEYLVRPGNRVTVTLPDGVTTTPGVITSVSPVATQAPGSAQAQGGGAAGSPGSLGQATVQLTVRLTHPGAAGNLDQAPVNVSIVTAQARDVLAVPVNALVALAGGGYAVEVVRGSARSLVAVRTGLFSNTLVQVSGAGLTAGLNVEVPSS
jgi:peptidoglycan hydrolase-like protein with peptidoglycan-binding domain